MKLHPQPCVLKLSLPVIMKLIPKPCVLLKFCTFHYEAPSTAICATDFLYLSLRKLFHSSVCKCHSLSDIMKFLSQLSGILTFCTFHYEAPSTALCATDNLYFSLWSYTHSSVCYWHSVPVIMKLLQQPCVLLILCSFHYGAPSKALFPTDIPYMSISCSFHSSLCYWHTVPFINKLIPQICVFLIICNCPYEAPFTVLCATDTVRIFM